MQCKVTDYIGKGAKGRVFRLTYANRDGTRIGSTAIKVVKDKKSRVLSEIFYHAQFARMGIAPRLFHFQVLDRCYVIEMEEIATVVDNPAFLNKASAPIIEGLLDWIEETRVLIRSRNFLHGDLHLRNVGMVYDLQDRAVLRPLLIDFGWSFHHNIDREIDSVASADVAQYMMSLDSLSADRDIVRRFGNNNPFAQRYTRLLEEYQQDVSLQMTDDYLQLVIPGDTDDYVRRRSDLYRYLTSLRSLTNEMKFLANQYRKSEKPLEKEFLLAFLHSLHEPLPQPTYTPLFVH
jgi:hypothetical protein